MGLYHDCFSVILRTNESCFANVVLMEHFGSLASATRPMGRKMRTGVASVATAPITNRIRVPLSLNCANATRPLYPTNTQTTQFLGFLICWLVSLVIYCVSSYNPFSLGEYVNAQYSFVTCHVFGSFRAAVSSSSPFYRRCCIVCSCIVLASNYYAYEISFSSLALND